ncbi:MAG: hypothetical protein RLZ25_1722 [Pseudomonadota bacterium]|jgi:uncharacterized cysteine cluster protein YcgN (CxxCxxCC family)
MAAEGAVFWASKSLAELSAAEWEALCDGCGRCCLHKLEDEDTGELYYTRVACRQLNLETCRCRSYEDRTQKVPGCLDLKKDPEALAWLPSTCAYRLRRDGELLPVWHPLVSGRSESVHEAGISVRKMAVTETGLEDLEDFIVEDLI